MAETRDLNGLRGWLILVGFVVVATPIRLVTLLAGTFYPILTDGTWAALTTPGQPAYNALWAPILAGEMLVNAILLVMWIVLGVLFFTKRRLFPLVFRVMLVASLVFIVADAYLIKLVMPDQEVFDADTLKELARSVVACAIWIPYTLLSERVRQTFVN